MTALDKLKAIQDLLGVKSDGVPGPITRAAFADLCADAVAPQQRAPLDTRHSTLGILSGDGTWPFTARIIGGDIVCEDIIITCFGGGYDPQDNGQTASGVSTLHTLKGVSIAMDGRQFPHLSPAEHRALDGAPFPKLPWNTPVEVTINGVTFTPDAGIIDLGPGKQASRPGEPHALDLTPAAAAFFKPTMPLQRLSVAFEERGSFRILGGAKLAGLV